MESSDRIVARFESYYVPTLGADEEHSTDTYILQKGMFPQFWPAIQAAKGKCILAHEGEIPRGLGGVFIDLLAGSDLAGSETTEDPEVTFVVNWKFESVFGDPCSHLRFTRINNLRRFLGKEHYIA